MANKYIELFDEDTEEKTFYDHLDRVYKERYQKKGVTKYLFDAGHEVLEKNIKKGSYYHILEVGPGFAPHTPFILHKYQKITYVEPNSKCNELLNGTTPLKNDEQPIEIEIRNSAFPDSLLSSNTYDRVIACHTIEHIPQPSLVIRDMYRVLKPGGVLSITLPCDPGIIWRCAKTMGPGHQFRKLGINYDYFSYKEHVNSIFSLQTFIKHLFKDHKMSVVWWPSRLPFADLNLFYICNIYK